MNSEPAHKKRKSNPIKLIWLITLLSFSVGVFMVYLVWSTFTNLNTDRDKLFQLKETLNSMQANLKNGLAQRKSELSTLLKGTADDNITAEKYHLPYHIKNYRKILSSTALNPVFDELEIDSNSLLTLKDKLTWWASAYNRTIPRIPQARKKVGSILDRILETADKAEGQQRLERAAIIRQMRRNAIKNSSEITVSDINKIAALNNFSIIRRDITDLVHLSERLHIITEADNLADLKDNKIRTLLAKVRFNTQLSKGEKSVGKTQLNSLLGDYETALFGQGYSIDNNNQIIVLGYGGEYNLILDRLKMEKEREHFRIEINQIYDSIEVTLDKILAATQIITQQELTKDKKVLSQTWLTMIIIWLVTSIIYVMLAYEIIMAAKQQIRNIEDSNTDLEAMTDELRKSEERLRRLSSDLFKVQENERRRISLELHDELGQSMAALKMQVGSVARRLGSVPQEELKEFCNDMRDNINQIIENVRRLARDLSPVVLDDLGLQAAIEYLVNNFLKIYNVEIKYRYVDINHLFNEDSQRIIYRILQEALNNIGKHAQAENVSLIIEKKVRAIRFTVRDDGKGFNVQKTLDQKGAERGMGLEAMSERVRILGGKINIVSRPGIDTTVTFTAPIR